MINLYCRDHLVNQLKTGKSLLMKFRLNTELELGHLELYIKDTGMVRFYFLCKFLVCIYLIKYDQGKKIRLKKICMMDIQ